METNITRTALVWLTLGGVACVTTSAAPPTVHGTKPVSSDVHVLFIENLDELTSPYDTARLERSARKTQGVLYARADRNQGSLEVGLQSPEDLDALEEAIEDAGFDISNRKTVRRHEEEVDDDTCCVADDDDVDYSDDPTEQTSETDELDDDNY